MPYKDNYDDRDIERAEKEARNQAFSEAAKEQAYEASRYEEKIAGLYERIHELEAQLDTLKAKNGAEPNCTCKDVEPCPLHSGKAQPEVSASMPSAYDESIPTKTTGSASGVDLPTVRKVTAEEIAKTAFETQYPGANWENCIVERDERIKIAQAIAKLYGEKSQ